MFACRLPARGQGGIVGDFFACGADLGAQSLDVQTWEPLQQRCQDLIAVDQAIAQRFQPVHGAGLCSRPVGPDVQLCTQGLGIGMTHELADVMHLAAFAFVAMDALRQRDGVTQRFVQRQLGQFGCGQCNQLATQVEQRMHVAFDLGFAGPPVFGEVVRGGGLGRVVHGFGHKMIRD